MSKFYSCKLIWTAIVICGCKNTCFKKDGANRKGCPCKTAKLFCSESCDCGTKEKQCVNKVG